MAELYRSRYFTFTKNGGTGSQTVSVGWQPTAVLLWTVRHTGLADDIGGELQISHGLSDGATQSCRFARVDGSSNSSQAERTNAIAYWVSATSGGTPTLEVEGRLTGFTSTGFTINWLTNDGAATRMHALVFGGDVQAMLRPTKITVDAPGTIAVSDVGFQPDCFIVLGGAADEFGTGDYSLGKPYGSFHGYGFSNASAHRCGWSLTMNGTGTYSELHDNRDFSVRVANTGAGEELCGGRITAIGASGFTITRDVGTTTHQPIQHVLCLRGARFQIGTLNSRTSVGTQTLTLPFQPRAALFMSQGLDTLDSLYVMQAYGLGAWQDTTSYAAGAQGSIWISGGSGSYTNSRIDSSKALTVRLSDGSLQFEGDVVAVSPTSITFDWTTLLFHQSSKVVYMAFGPTETFTEVPTLDPIDPSEEQHCCSTVVNPKVGETTAGDVVGADKFVAYSPWTRACIGEGMVEEAATPSDSESW